MTVVVASGNGVGVGTGAGADTVMADVPVTVLTPSVAEAVMVAVPGATAVTRPAASTVAIVTSDEDHVMVAPAKPIAFWSRAEATRDCVAPVVSDAVAGVTVTDVRTGTTTGVETVIA